MTQTVESVMNVSEGRDLSRLQKIAQSIQAVPDAFLLDCHADADHHRSVFSAIGTPASVAEAALAAVEAAVGLIDLRKHKGVHPRIGAVDVLPFVPIRDVSMEECICIAHETGREIARRWEIPVYFYGEAALTPSRRSLAEIRRGQFEGLSKEILENPRRRPDCGPSRLHPTAGAIAVGARIPLIAFNIYLDVPDPDPARQIAFRVREGGGGLPGIRALGLYLERRQGAQVSMNVTDYRTAGLVDVFNRVREEARRLGCDVASSEIVGLVPQDALPEDTVEHIHLEGFAASKVLENRIAAALDHKCSGNPEPFQPTWKLP